MIDGPDKKNKDDDFDTFWNKAEIRFNGGDNPSEDDESGRHTVPDFGIVGLKKKPEAGFEPPFVPLPAQDENLPAPADDDSPEISVEDETAAEIKHELLHLLIEETAERIREFRFNSITVEANKKYLAAAIFKTLQNTCPAVDLDAEMDDQAFTITVSKKTGIDYNGRVMNSKDAAVFGSLLRHYANAVKIK